eukprot:TRINITY_DN12028_c0_g1_i1.p1 TRINITY_DN12028_c0_g1~~TRINITY_DN12028_c0_g1_i1.p1  ORF type:complete len:259 (-),score=49.16 TRINITY_DN12028_c0_g1_i1:37-813(-)
MPIPVTNKKKAKIFKSKKKSMRLSSRNTTTVTTSSSPPAPPVTRPVSTNNLKSTSESNSPSSTSITETERPTSNFLGISPIKRQLPQLPPETEEEVSETGTETEHSVLSSPINSQANTIALPSTVGRPLPDIRDTTQFSFDQIDKIISEQEEIITQEELITQQEELIAQQSEVDSDRKSMEFTFDELELIKEAMTFSESDQNGDPYDVMDLLKDADVEALLNMASTTPSQVRYTQSSVFNKMSTSSERKRTPLRSQDG